jgi:hypothetical protein
VNDPALSLIILAVCALAGWWFLRRDQQMIRRDRQNLDAEIAALMREYAARAVSDPEPSDGRGWVCGQSGCKACS